MSRWTYVKVAIPIVVMILVVVFAVPRIQSWAQTQVPAGNGGTNTTTNTTGNSSASSAMNGTVQVVSSLLVALIPLIIIIGILGTGIGMFTGSYGLLGGLSGGHDDPDIDSSLVHQDEPAEQEATPEPPQPKKLPVEYNRVIRPRGVCRFCSGDLYTDELNCPHCGAPMHDAVPEGAAT